MKTAEEWVAEVLTGDYSSLTEEQCVQLIQIDALMHASQIVHYISRGTKSEQRSIAIDEARDAILDEIKLIK